jgi:2-methylcitrate dehydratase PrpD
MVELRRKVAATVDDSIAEEAADVTAVLKDGRREHVFVKHAIGSLERPLTDAMLEAKFRDQAEPVIGKAKVDAALAACWKLGEAKNVSAVVAAARP